MFYEVKNEVNSNISIKYCRDNRFVYKHYKFFLLIFIIHSLIAISILFLTCKLIWFNEMNCTTWIFRNFIFFSNKEHTFESTFERFNNNITNFISIFINIRFYRFYINIRLIKFCFRKNHSKINMLFINFFFNWLLINITLKIYHTIY